VRAHGERSRTTALAQAKEKARKVEDLENNEEIKDKLLLTKRRYKSHMAMWEGAASDDASVEWNEEFHKLRSQGISYKNEKGQDQIAITENTRIRTSTGKRTSKVDPESESYGGCRSLGQGGGAVTSANGVSTRPRRTARSSMGGHTWARSAASPGSSRAWLRGAELEEESEGSADRNSDAASAITNRSDRSRLRKAPSGEQATDPLSQAALHMHNKLVHGTRPPATDKSAGPGNKQLSPVELIQEKGALRAAMEKIINQQGSKKGVKARIEASEQLLTEDQRKDLEKASTEVLQPLHRAAHAACSPAAQGDACQGRQREGWHDGGDQEGGAQGNASSCR
jgi:hypothetical protein